MITIYVLVMYWGSYEDKSSCIAYAGTDEAKARDVAKNYYFSPWTDNIYANIEVWEDGAMVRELLVLEKY